MNTLINIINFANAHSGIEAKLDRTETLVLIEITCTGGSIYREQVSTFNQARRALGY